MKSRNLIFCFQNTNLDECEMDAEVLDDSFGTIFFVNRHSLAMTLSRKPLGAHFLNKDLQLESIDSSKISVPLLHALVNAKTVTKHLFGALLRFDQIFSHKAG